jgi:hypothetical protein
VLGVSEGLTIGQDYALPVSRLWLTLQDQSSKVMSEESQKVQRQPMSGESSESQSEGKSMSPPAFQLKASPIQAKAGANAPIQRVASPLADAVRIIKANNANTGSSYLTENLVRGIIEAEGEFLRNSPLDRWAESLGLAGTVGPGQLGEPAVNDVDSNYAASITQFAAAQGAAPSSWTEKATDPKWSYFYIAAYLALCIQRAESTFNPAASRTLTNDQIGLLDIGIAMYHGAFETIRALRRRVAQENNGIAPQAVSKTMVNAEMRSGTERAEERDLEQYTQLAEGGFDFDFDITAAMTSRRFQIYGGKAKVTSLANYVNSVPTDPARGNTYHIRLEKFEPSSGPGGAVGEGTNWYPWRVYTVGANQEAEWKDLPRGDYRFKVEKIEDPFTPDVLHGHGRVQTMY